MPPDLVAAAKLREIAQLEFTGNSIEGMAGEWSQAIAVQGLRSPDDMIARFSAVSASDVDRVFREYLNDATAVAAYAVPKNAGAASAGRQRLAKENNTLQPSSHEPLPPWAQRVLDDLHVPAQTLAPADMTLSNGVRLIVQPETITHTVVVRGEILNNPGVQEPAGEEGVADLASELLPYGTTTYDRVAFQRALDDVAASTTAGTDFGLDVLSADFDRGVALLADEELHPAFDPKSFAIVKQQSVAALTGEAKAPDHLAEIALADALYPPGDPERRFETPQSVGALSLDDVKRWYAAAYRPDLTTIVVIGDTTPERARAIVEKYFAGWQAAGAKPNVESPPVPANAASQIVVPATGRVQSSVRLVETVPIVRTDPAWALLRVANAALTGGFYSSLLYHDLREVHGYAYSIGSNFSAGKSAARSKSATDAMRRTSSRPRAKRSRFYAICSSSQSKRDGCCARRRCSWEKFRSVNRVMRASPASSPGTRARDYRSIRICSTREPSSMHRRKASARRWLVTSGRTRSFASSSVRVRRDRRRGRDDRRRIRHRPHDRDRQQARTGRFSAVARDDPRQTAGTCWAA